MVSGLVTSPNEFSLISSGEARLMVIFVKLVFTFVSFLEAIFLIILYSYLIQLHAQSKTTELMEKHIERLGDTWRWHGITLDDCLVSLGTASDIVTLDGKHFL